MLKFKVSYYPGRNKRFPLEIELIDALSVAELISGICRTDEALDEHADRVNLLRGLGDLAAGNATSFEVADYLRIKAIKTEI